MSIDQNYINTEEALGRLRGNSTIYKTLLGRFTQNTYLEQLRGEFSSGDMNAASHTVHTIKGLSANLSLSKIHETSMALEAQLKNGQDGAAEFATLEDAIIKTLDMIAELVPTL